MVPISQAYAAALDFALFGDQTSTAYDSFSQAVNQADSLEHFHLFHRPSSTTTQRLDNGISEETLTLEMHADIGLFIVMTSAEYFETASLAPLANELRPDPGLFLELPSGEVVRPRVPQDCLVVMNGEGAARWMRTAKGARKPQAARHEVALPDLLPGITRAWFGRMFFPLSQNLIQDSSSEQMTFAEYREQTYQALKDNKHHLASLSGCSPGHRRLMDVGGCKAGQLYCWMSCVDLPTVTNLPCPTDQVVCADPK